jgi:thiamine transport system permease protein
VRDVTRGSVRAWIPYLPVVAFVLLFALLPTALLFLMGVIAVGGLPGLARVPFNVLNGYAIQNSFLQGGLSALFALTAGYPLGVLIGRYAWRGRSLVRSVVIVPFLLPSLVVVLGVQDLFGAQGWVSGVLPGLRVLGSGLGGIVTVNVFYNAPIVALLTSIGVESSDPVLEDTVATLGGGPFARFRTVWGARSLMGAGAGALLTFLFSALAFAAPLLMCGASCYTVEGWVWALDQQLLSPGMASALALVLVLLMVPPTAIYLFLWGRLRPAGGGSATRSYPIPWKDPRAWPVLLAGIALVVAVGALLGAVMLQSFRASSPGAGIGSAWGELFAPSIARTLGISTIGALGNTLLYASVSTILAVLFGIMVGYGRRRSSGVSRSLQLVLFLPLLISPVVLSFALASFWRPIFGGESMVWLLIILSQTTLALPFALQSLVVALSRVPATFREAAQTLGSRPWPAYLDTEIPLVRGGLITAGLFAFALSLGEFTATYFLAIPRFTTLPVEIYRLQGVRLTAPANALAGLLVIVSLLTFLGITFGGRRVEL